MTDGFIIANADAWARKFSELKDVNDGFDQASDPSDKTVAMDKLVQTEVDLLRMGAPDISAVIEKLLMIWHGQVDSDDQEAEFKRIVIGDLRRIEALDR